MPRRFSHHWLLRTVSIGSLCAALWSAGAQAQSQTYSFDIHQQPLSGSLRDYARVSGQQIIFTDDLVAGFTGKALHGGFSSDSALSQLLAGTGLVVERSDAGALMIRRERHAQAASVPDAGAAATETVTVTGSRVISDGASSPTPLTVVNTTQLLATTPSNIPDALNKLPAFAGSSSQRTTGNASSNTTGNFLNLRGFGSQRTLILLDGNRVPATATNGTVDINTLPQMLMQRVDVVTGGASAVYGSDAVTGVVNFILNTRFEGLKITGQGGVSSEGDDASYKFGIAAGTELFGGRGHFEISYEHYSSDGIPDMNDRPLGSRVYTESGAGSASKPYHLAINSRLASYTPGGYINGTANPALNDHFFVSNGVLVPFTHGLDTGSSGDESGGDGGYAGQGYPGSGADPWLLASLRTDQLFGRFDYDLADNVHFYAQASAAQSYNFNVFFTQWFSATILSGNPYLPASVQAAMTSAGTQSFTLSRTLQSEPGYTSRGLTGNIDATAGLGGTVFGGFTWDLHYTHGESRLHEADPNNINQQRLFAALDAVTNSAGQVVCRVSTSTTTQALYPNCVPLDPFGPTSETKTGVQYIDDYTDFVETNKIDDFAGSISGALFDDWAGPVKAAASAEYRKMSLTTTSNFPATAKVNCALLNAASCNSSAQLWTSNVVSPMAASEGVWETAIEADAPLLKDLPLVKMLSINAAARYTQYSVSGPASTWKAGLVWNLNDEMTFRGTTSRDIRAPTVFDLYSPVSSGLSSYSDILTNSSGNIQSVSQGNANLKPEVALTTTAGIVYKPSWLENFSISADWYMIGIKNAITNVSGTNATIQNQCIASGGSSPYCALYIRPFAITNTTSANYPSAVLSESLNVARTSTHGIDVEANYSFDLADIDESWPGSLQARLLVAYQPSLLAQTVAGAVVTNAAGAVPLAAGRVTFNLGYTNGPLGVDLEQRWHSSERQNSNPTLVFSDPSVPSIAYTDLTVSYRLKFLGGDADSATEAFVSIQNLFDQQPHIWIGTGLTGAQGFSYPTPSDEDVIGRYFTAGVRYSL